MITEQNLDGFFNNPLINSACLWAPLLVLGVSLCFLRHQHIAVKIMSPPVFAFATFCLCFGLPWAWLFRDGLGPDSVTSHGQEAVARFMKDFCEILLFCTGLFAVGLVPVLVSALVRRRANRLAHP